jgi:hypothetical protein
MSLRHVTAQGGVREHLELAENGDEDSDITQQSLLEPVAKFLTQNAQVRMAITNSHVTLGCLSSIRGLLKRRIGTLLFGAPLADIKFEFKFSPCMQLGKRDKLWLLF